MVAKVSQTFLKFYVAYAASGAAIGFALPWLRLFGVIP